MVKALVITGFGINCEEEMAAAFKQAGAEALIVHLNEILQEKISIHDFDILSFPGGFSFGDDLASGKVMANKIKYKRLPSGGVLIDEIKRFLTNGKYIIGVCNGFQMLVRMGLLPNLGLQFEPQATLSNNNSAKFEDRWVKCLVNPNSNSPFLKGITHIDLPARHGEGKLIFLNDSVKKQIEEQALNCMSYCLPDGTPTDQYPYNPNGAELNCAGLISSDGQVFGLMPHPEAFLSKYNHPNWASMKRNNEGFNEEGDGVVFFKNIVDHIQTETT